MILPSLVSSFSFFYDQSKKEYKKVENSPAKYVCLRVACMLVRDKELEERIELS
jgi:hypothetical protein